MDWERGVVEEIDLGMRLEGEGNQNEKKKEQEGGKKAVLTPFLRNRNFSEKAFLDFSPSQLVFTGEL